MEARLLNWNNATDSPTTHAQSISSGKMPANADPKTRTLEGLIVLKQRHIGKRHPRRADKLKCMLVTCANQQAPLDAQTNRTALVKKAYRLVG